MWRMRSWFGRRSASLVGLDIGSSAVKAVQLEPARAGWRVVAAGAAPVPPQAVVDGEIVDADGVAAAIRSVVEAQRIRATTAAASLAGSAVVVRRLAVPKRSGSELDESIYWEVDQHVPFDIGEVTLDYRVLDSASDGEDADTLDVLLVVARKDRVAGHARAIRRAGLAPAVIDVDAFALHNAWEATGGAAGGAVTLVHAGARTVTIAVVRGGRLEHARDASLAPDPPPASAALARDVLATGAEMPGGAWSGVVRPGGEAVDASDDTSTAAGAGAAGVSGGAVVERVAREVESMREERFSAAGSEEPVERLVVSGGWSCAPDFAAALGERLAAPAARFEPFRGLDVAPRAAASGLVTDAAPAAAVAVGLALRRGDDA